MHTELETLPSSAVLKTHGACISRYSADYQIEKYLIRKWKELSDTEALKLKLLAYHLVVVHLLGSYTVYFEVNCLLLKETRKSQAWRKAFLRKTSDRGFNMEYCKEYLLNPLSANPTK